MDTPDLMVALQRSGHVLADAAEGHLGQPVPTCPGWTMADLLGHLAGVEGFWTAVLQGTAPADVTRPPRPPDPELIDWFRSGVDALVALLGPLDPATPQWNWSDQDPTIGWVQRRMTHESVMHSWDGANAVGRAEPIDTEIAVDGIDEFLDVFVGARAERMTGPVETVHVHVTDGEGEWLLTAGEGSTSLERTHAKGDVAVRGPASDLLLALWSRPRSDQVEVIGDPSVLDRLLAAATI
jgi:uncharacterized protein (TIGR03083 family)